MSLEKTLDRIEKGEVSPRCADLREAFAYLNPSERISIGPRIAAILLSSKDMVNMILVAKKTPSAFTLEKVVKLREEGFSFDNFLSIIQDLDFNSQIRKLLVEADKQIAASLRKAIQSGKKQPQYEPKSEAGRLLMKEISSYDLTPGDRVILSSCHTTGVLAMDGSGQRCVIEIKRKSEKDPVFRHEEKIEDFYSHQEVRDILSAFGYSYTIEEKDHSQRDFSALMAEFGGKNIWSISTFIIE